MLDVMTGYMELYMHVGLRPKLANRQVFAGCHNGSFCTHTTSPETDASSDYAMMNMWWCERRNSVKS